MENIYPDTFFIAQNRGVIMTERFRISTVVENGHPHYKVEDLVNGNEIHCDFGELNNILYELMGE